VIGQQRIGYRLEHFGPARRLGILAEGEVGGRGLRRWEDGVPEPPTGVLADPTGQPRVYHRLRPHHRRCGEQLQCHVLIFRAGYGWVFRKLGFGPRKRTGGSGPRGGGRHPGLIQGSRVVTRRAYRVT
jgi:hypothetical protein